MAETKKLGKVMLTPRGEYKTDVSYNRLDIVSYDGSSYIANQDTDAGEVPGDSDQFTLVASKGDTGKTGADGKDGEDGVDGKDGAKGEKGNTVLDSENDQIEFAKPIITKGIIPQTISRTDTIDVDETNLVKRNGNNVISATGSYYLYFSELVPTEGNVMSASIDVKGYKVDDDGIYDFAIIFYDGKNTRLAPKYLTNQTPTEDWTTIKIENLAVPEGAKRAMLRVHSNFGLVLDLANPVFNVGEKAIKYTDEKENLVKNSEMAEGLEGYYSTEITKYAPDMSTIYLKTNVRQDETYKVEMYENLKGTLPAELAPTHTLGGYYKVQGASENGIGGIIETIFAQGSMFQRQFSYKWSDWKFVSQVYGSFDKAGAFHSLKGEIVKGGVVYNREDDSFYALADDGKPYTPIGWQTLPIGTSHGDIKVKLLKGGKIDDDITSNSVVSKYIDSVNAATKDVSKKASMQVLVSDTHGNAYSEYVKAFLPLYTGYQFTDFKEGVLKGITTVLQNDVDTLNYHYYITLAALWTNRSAKNIKRIVSQFNNQPFVYSHAGDVTNGYASTISEEIADYDEGASIFKNEEWNIVDGNHDEQSYKLERRWFIREDDNSKSAETSLLTNANHLDRRSYEDRWKNSYNQTEGWFTKTDDVAKVIYLYLDTFDGAEMTQTSGYDKPYPKGGLPYFKGSKMSIKQLQWLCDTLLKVPDGYAVSIISHTIPARTFVGNTPINAEEDKANLNQDLLAGIMLSFQNSTAYKASSSVKKSGFSIYDVTAFIGDIDVDFTGKPKDRVAVWNYGHYHSYGHVTRAGGANFNFVQLPNLVGKEWGYIGDTRSSQFTTEIVDTETRKVHVLRFSPTISDQNDIDFTVDY